MAREMAENITKQTAVVRTLARESLGFRAISSLVALISLRTALRVRLSSVSHSIFHVKVDLAHKLYNVSILIFKGASVKYFLIEGAPSRALHTPESFYISYSLI